MYNNNKNRLPYQWGYAKMIRCFVLLGVSLWAISLSFDLYIDQIKSSEFTTPIFSTELISTLMPGEQRQSVLHEGEPLEDVD